MSKIKIQVGTVRPHAMYYNTGPSPWMTGSSLYVHPITHGKTSPMFTQKHYVAIADVIHERRVEIKEVYNDANMRDGNIEQAARLDEVAQITVKMIDLFKKDNPKFKQFTFIEHCNRDLKE